MDDTNLYIHIHTYAWMSMAGIQSVQSFLLHTPNFAHFKAEVKSTTNVWSNGGGEDIAIHDREP